MVEGTMATAFLVGLLGGVHCIGMCGGIVGMLTAGLQDAARSSLGRISLYHLAYNGGRIAGYTLAGALMGTLGILIAEVVPIQHAQRALYALAAIFMIGLGLYLAGWWRGLATVERAGVGLWRLLEPLGRRLAPVARLHQAIGLGFVWAWLPCGLVYSVLIWSVSAGSAMKGALLMLAFGLGTLPNLLAMGMLAGAAARLTSRPWIRRAAGALVMGFGLHALWRLYI
jgi:sulfite exporter TauE/SafE